MGPRPAPRLGSGWSRRTVVKHVPKVAAAAGATDFGPGRTLRAVLAELDGVAGDGGKEARPFRAGIILGIRVEEVGAAAGAGVHPGFFVVEERARKRRFGPGFPKNPVLLRGQLPIQTSSGIIPGALFTIRPAAAGVAGALGGSHGGVGRDAARPHRSYSRGRPPHRAGGRSRRPGGSRRSSNQSRA